MAAINLNADHFKGWTLIPGQEHRFPCIQFPQPGGSFRPRQIIVNEPPGNMRQHDEVARVLANAPEVARRACDLLEGLDTVNLPQSMAARVRKLREALAKSCG